MSNENRDFGSPTPAGADDKDEAKKLAAVMDELRRCLLNGLMASDATALEHSLYRTRLYRGSRTSNPCESWIRMSHAAARERAGKWRAASDKVHTPPPDGQVSRASTSLEKRGWWERRGVNGREAGKGPGTPYEYRLVADAFPADAPGPRSTLAYAAIKSLSLHVGIGPERELALCQLWWHASESEHMISGTREELKKVLGINSERWAVQLLRDLASADMGVHLEELPPAPGRRAKLYVVRLRLPNQDRMARPKGGALYLSDRERRDVERFRVWMGEQAASAEAAPAVTSGDKDERVEVSVSTAPKSPDVAEVSEKTDWQDPAAPTGWWADDDLSDIDAPEDLWDQLEVAGEESDRSVDAECAGSDAEGGRDGGDDTGTRVATAAQGASSSREDLLAELGAVEEDDDSEEACAAAVAWFEADNKAAGAAGDEPVAEAGASVSDRALLRGLPALEFAARRRELEEHKRAEELARARQHEAAQLTLGMV